MTENETLIRKLYALAEIQDSASFAALFASDGYFLDVPSAQTFYGVDTAKPVDAYARTFPDMHRELGNFVESGETIVVELTLNGTHQGPLLMADGDIKPTGKRIKVPCCDIFTIKNGKIQSFHCYNAASVLMAQIGVLGNISSFIVPNT